jgi:hypothetical protein
LFGSGALVASASLPPSARAAQAGVSDLASPAHARESDSLGADDLADGSQRRVLEAKWGGLTIRWFE